MKLSKLIRELQIIKQEHGDIEANIFSYDNGDGDVEEVCWSLCTSEIDNDVVESLTFCDQSFVDAFCD